MKKITREDAKKLYAPKSTYAMKMHFIDKIYDDVERAMMGKDIEIAELSGRLMVMTSEVRRLHPDDCNCMLCVGKNNVKKI